MFVKTLATALFVTTLLTGAPLATFPPPGGALENINVAPSGTIYTSAVDNGNLYATTPGGTKNLFAQVPPTLRGLSRDLDGTLVGVSSTGFYRFGSDGSASLVTQVAGSQFLNGVTLFSAGTFLIADSRTATLWQVNLTSGTARPWLTDTLLGAVPGATSQVGANGVKLYGGAVYVSNTSSASVLRIPINADGSPGQIQTYASNLQLDDFAFAADGSIFGATQGGNSVVRLTANGQRSIIATAADGLFGDAALAFGRTAADAQDIFVISNGGSFLNLPGGPQPGSIIRFDVGIAGVTPESQAVPEPSAFLPAGLLAIGLIVRSSKR